MKKVNKIIIITILTLIIIFVAYITFDCIRLRNSSLGTKPLITINEKITENRLVYTGLGYKIEYYLNSKKDEDFNNLETIEERCYGVAFWLFDKIIIWGWVE